MNPLDPRFAYLRSWDRDVLMQALRASGSFRGVGNRIPGTKVLYDHLRSTGQARRFTLNDCFDVMTDLQELAIAVLRAPAWRGARSLMLYYRGRLALADRIHRSHGGTGECLCLWCRLWRMRLGELEEVLSEY